VRKATKCETNQEEQQQFEAALTGQKGAIKVRTTPIFKLRLSFFNFNSNFL